MEKIIELGKFYDILKQSYIKFFKKNVKGSLFLKMIEAKGRSRFDILESASLHNFEINKDIKEELLKEGYIREGKDINEYIITGKGTVYYETQKSISSKDDIIDYLDIKFFNISKKTEKKVDSVEKVILLSLIAARAFSKESSIDCTKSNEVLDLWKKIFEESYELLKNLKIIDSEEPLFEENKGNQHIIAKTIRAKSELFEKVKNIYKLVSGQNSRFLDMTVDKNIIEEKLIFLFNKIFEKNLDYISINKVNEFLIDISEKYYVYLFDSKTHVFKSMDYDDIIKDCLIKSCK
ncbi:MAG: hypothetical protein WC393_02100 [Candidatus Nanoarchaeia archaeon]